MSQNSNNNNNTPSSGAADNTGGSGGAYYLDIETTGFTPENSKVITIQYCKLERYTGKRIGQLYILKEWESSEREILQKFINSVNLQDTYPFTFIPVGYNLKFENNFLYHRSMCHNLFPIKIFSRPYIDLHQLSILMNKGEFKGTKLNNFTNKPSDGSDIPNWYSQREYDKIINYITRETAEFVKFIEWAYKTIPDLKPKLEAHFQNS